MSRGRSTRTGRATALRTLSVPLACVAVAVLTSWGLRVELQRSHALDEQLQRSSSWTSPPATSRPSSTS